MLPESAGRATGGNAARRHAARALLIFSLAWATVISPGVDADDRWLLIDTQAQTLTLMRGAEPEKHFANIAIGRNGTSSRHSQDDDTTPVGRYRITDIRDSDRYHRFVALDYPNLQDAAEGLASGLIEPIDYQRILRAHEQGLQPPADTALGGHIGIHGLGDGDPRFHADYNWTNGCVALTNEEIDDLIARIGTGMTVIIR